MVIFHSYGGAITILNMLVAGKISKQSGFLVFFWIFAGWWCNNHLEKYEFVNGWWIIPYIVEHKNVPNHQPEYLGLICDSR